MFSEHGYAELENTELALGSPLGRSAEFWQAFGAVAAHFCASYLNSHSKVALDLLHQLFIELTLKFPDLAATEACHVDVVTRAAALVIVPFPTEMKQVQLVDEPVTLQKVNRAVNRNARHFWIDSLCAAEDIACCEMLAGRLHYLQQRAALSCEADSAGCQGLLEPPRRFVNIDAFTRRCAVRGRSWHFSGPVST